MQSLKKKNDWLHIFVLYLVSGDVGRGQQCGLKVIIDHNSLWEVFLSYI